VAVISALIAGGRVVFRYLIDPKDSLVQVRYQGVADAPMVSLVAVNDGTRPGSIDRAALVVIWKVDGQDRAFAVPLPLGTPLIIPPGQASFSLPINFWKNLQLAKQLRKKL
jgi:hypothetical protein